MDGNRPLIDTYVQAWQNSLGQEFSGKATAFVAAGDAVLARLSHHIQVASNADLHVYEQIDRATGAQYNAKDLTWSYAELLSALELRQSVLESI